jgi:hypothetical protein
VSPHFWGPTTSSYAKISIIYNKGAQYTYEDVVWHAWGNVLNTDEELLNHTQAIPVLKNYLAGHQRRCPALGLTCEGLLGGKPL